MVRFALAVLAMLVVAFAGAESATAGPGPGIAYFEPQLEHWGWFRLNPATGARERVAQFSMAEEPRELAFSADGKRAVVTTALWNAGWSTRYWEIRLPQGGLVPLPAPPGVPVEVAYDGAGNPLALTSLARQPASEWGATAVAYEGRTVPVVGRGDLLPELCFTYRYDGGAWKRLETAAIRFESDEPRKAVYARYLPSWRKRAPDAEDMLEADWGAARESSPARLQALESLDPLGRVADRHWLRWKLPASELFAPVVAGSQPTGPLVMLRQGEWQVLKETRFLGALDVQWRAPYLLVSGGRSMQRHTGMLVYDLGRNKLVFESDRALLALFWP